MSECGIRNATYRIAFFMLLLSSAASPILADGFEPGGGAVPAEPCSCGPACPFPVDPVPSIYTFSGEFHHSPVDLRIPGRGFDFVWARKYRSRCGPQSVMGVGWDFSYNIRIEQAGPDGVVLFDGNTRADLYTRQPDGVTFARDEFFRSGEFDPNGSFVLTFADRGSWRFHPLDGSPQSGKIVQSADRNGNTMQFLYDGGGNLNQVIDTLGRPIQINYNADGFVQSVIDFAGRTVTYEYYQDGDAGGSFGDLKSATTPAVVSTAAFPIPPGHEYPSGKTTAYTYSTGFADVNLNHNLLAITDPKGQSYLVNTYATTLNPADLEYDRLVRQVRGDPGDIIDLSYVPETPAPENGFAVIRTIVNDAMGNVEELFHDPGNRLVMRREFTGRADPDQPTTATTNRPSGKLRPGDPGFFESRWEYNIDSLPVVATDPNGNTTLDVYALDLDPLAPRRSRGNLREVDRLPGPLGGDQPLLSEFFEYDEGMGGCCGTNFVTRHVDARGNETVHEYDSAGNRTKTTHRTPSIVGDFEYNAFGQMTRHIHPDNGSGTRRIDVFTYYTPADGDQNGYLRSEMLDQGGFELTTTYEYDAVGNRIRTIDPRGHDSQLVVNQLNQVILEISREVTDGSGIRYTRESFFDANDKVVRVDVLNMDEEGVIQPNGHFTTTWEYETLNHAIRETEEVEEGLNVVTEFEYDANRNRTLIRHGEATSGSDPDNVTGTLYDERELVFQVIRAQGSPGESTRQYDYDGNRNLTRESEGLEDSPRVTTHLYDGYDRLVTEEDPMGNGTTLHYDANGNRVSVRVDGELVDVPGSGGNVRLFEAAYAFDAMDRLIVESIEHFDPATQSALGDGASVTVWEYSDESEVTRTVDDNLHETTTTYDSANRKSVVTDHLGNSTTHVYDSNSNVIMVTELEKSQNGGPDESFTTTYVYDNLDRRTRMIDSLGDTIDYGYDSRGNRTLRSDALRADPSSPGNVTRYGYDGLDRLTSTTRVLTDDGTGSGAPFGEVVTTRTWDDSSRLTGETDDNGNTTTYAYDSLDRRTAVTFADGTSRVAGYDVHDNPVLMSDAKGSESTCAYDALDRLTGKTIVPGAGVSGDTTFESYAYDGLSRIVRGEDDDSLVIRSYDSLSNLTSETLNGSVTTCEYDGVGNRTRCVYPAGRDVNVTFDPLDRPKTIADGGGLIATYAYIGRERVERLLFGNGVTCDFTYDGARRMIGTSHEVGGTPVDVRASAWDAMYNKIRREDTRPGGSMRLQEYTYDSLHRMVRSVRTPGAGAPVVKDYGLDGAGNRSDGYNMSAAAPIPADAQMNQYTSTPEDRRVYDENGNLIRILRSSPGGVRTVVGMRYDAFDRMVEESRVAVRGRRGSLGAGPAGLRGGQGGEILEQVRHVYAYDVFGRRIAKVVGSDGASPRETRFFYAGRSVVEERDGSGVTTATYVYGGYIDEVLEMTRGGSEYFFHGDDMHNVMAVTDAAGSVVERYDYDDFGAPEFSDAGGNRLAGSAIGNPYLFTGRRFDLESGLYYYRARYLDPATGRFTTRDPIGLFGDAINLGNGLTYAGNNPWTNVDPSGLDTLEQELVKALEGKTVATVKKSLEALVKKGLLPPGFADYAEILYRGAKAVLKAGEGLKWATEVKIAQASRFKRRSGVLRRGGRIYRYIIIGSGKRGKCDIHIQRLERVCLSRNFLGVCTAWGMRWRPYKVIHGVPCCNYVVSF